MLLAAKVHWTICLTARDLGKGTCYRYALNKFYGAKIEKDWKIFYKIIYFCKSFSDGFSGREALCRKTINS